MASALTRLLLVEMARGILPPDEPEVLRLFAGVLWRLEVRSRRERVRSLRAAARALGVSSRTAEGYVREAHDVDLQRRLEELVLPKVESAWLDRYASLEGTPGPGLLLGLTAPHPLMAIAVLAHHDSGMGCLEPRETAPAVHRSERWMRQRFLEERGELPVGWMGTAEASTALAAGGRVFVAIDAPADALPVACAPETPVRPVLVHRERDKRWRIVVGLPGTLDAARSAIRAHAASWPGQALLRAGIDASSSAD